MLTLIAMVPLKTNLQDRVPVHLGGWMETSAGIINESEGNLTKFKQRRRTAVGRYGRNYHRDPQQPRKGPFGSAGFPMQCAFGISYFHKETAQQARVAGGITGIMRAPEGRRAVPNTNAGFVHRAGFV